MNRLKSLFGAQDMTVGKPMNVLLKFAIPLLIGNLAQQLYSTVDAIIVGHFEGDAALAAVGASGSFLNLMIALFMGVSTGAGIVVSQYYGAKDRKMLSNSIGNVLTLTFVISIIVTVLGLIFTRPFMELMNTPEDIIDDACMYLWIFSAGFIGCTFYNMIAGVLRGLGDTVMPLVFLLITCGINIVLDLVFVAWFGMGVAGVALATVLSQGVSAVLCVIRLKKMSNTFDFDKKYFKLDKHLASTILRVGLPAGLTQAIFSMAGIVIQSLVNSFGTYVIATALVVMRVDGFAMLPCFAFGMTMTTYVGQNIGANQMDRVNRSGIDGTRLALFVTVPIVLVLFFFGEGLMMIFTDTPEVVDFGFEMLRMMSAGYIAMAISQVLTGIMRGAGDTVTPMIISVISTVLIRVPVAYGMAYFTRSEALPNGEPSSIFYSLMISWVLGAVISVVYYKIGKWKTKSIIKAK